MGWRDTVGREAIEKQMFDQGYDPACFQFAFNPPEGWQHEWLPWGQAESLKSLLEREPHLRNLTLNCVWYGADMIWGFRDDDAPWEDPT